MRHDKKTLHRIGGRDPKSTTLTLTQWRFCALQSATVNSPNYNQDKLPMKVKKGIKTDFTGIPLDNPFEPESYETNETGETVASHSPLPWRRSSFNDYLVIADSRGCATICDCTNRIFAD